MKVISFSWQRASIFPASACTDPGQRFRRCLADSDYMRDIVEKIGAIIVFASLGGCASVPSPEFEPNVVGRSIEIGATTRQQLIELLGEPSWEDPFTRTLYYQGQSKKETLCAIYIVPSIFFPMPFPWCESIESDWLIDARFDERGRLTQLDTNEGERAKSMVENPKHTALRARAGNPDAAFQLHRQLIENGLDTRNALKWLCVAANAGHGKAQTDLGLYHASSTQAADVQPMIQAGVKIDRRTAYMWFELATANGDDLIKELAYLYRSALQVRMTESEIKQGEQLARDWRPGQCPSP